MTNENYQNKIEADKIKERSHRDPTRDYENYEERLKRASRPYSMVHNEQYDCSSRHYG
ncbi:hypothetical protein KW805_04105 [Candidatus Pacearchaeota archaeon]|nr:hypothetical protein [Candidatus Pacearchaeota archaeon]